jgi:hypothetical protein
MVTCNGDLAPARTADACFDERVRTHDDATDRWLFERAVDRVRAVDAIVAEYATAICGRPARRRDHPPEAADGSAVGVTWSIDGDVLVTFTPSSRGPSVVTVSEIGLLQPLRKQLRSRHLRIEYRTR